MVLPCAYRIRRTLMKEIDINFPKLDLLYDKIKQRDTSKLPIIERNLNRGAFGVSERYLKIAKTENMGPPNMMKGCEVLDKPIDGWQDIIDDVNNLLPFGKPAIFAYYPKNGYIGWHDNSDAPGYTILFNHSEDGNGFYRFVNEDNEIITIQDKVGWSCKTGYYGTRPSSTWHCAYTKNPRYSIAYIFKKKSEYRLTLEQLYGIMEIYDKKDPEQLSTY